MALLPYILSEPPKAISPVLVDSPHSGRVYPADFAYTCPLPLLRQAEDAFVDEVVAGAPEAGATLLTAEFPRSLIDLNRSESDIDPEIIDGIWEKKLTPGAMTLLGFGLIRRMCRNGIELYRHRLPTSEIERRIETYYRPYHTCLQRLIEERLHRFGMCYLFDMHSMPDRVESGVPRPDFILGNKDGQSCSSFVTQRAYQILSSMGYSVGLNDPYKGREIVERYGLQGLGAQALQIEINRKLYMDEILIEKHAGFTELQKNLTEFFKSIVLLAEEGDTQGLAAE